MKRRIVVFISVMLTTVSLLYAVSPISVGQSKGIKLSLDYSGLANASIKFTTVDVGNAYDDYEKTSGVGASGMMLTVPSGNVKAEADVFISWRIYSADAITIRLKMDGPLTSGGTNVNWKVTAGNGNSMGSDSVQSFDYSSAKEKGIVVYESSAKKGGYSGSCSVGMLTQSLVSFEKGTYVAHLIANVVSGA